MIKDKRFEDLRIRAEEILKNQGIDDSVEYINDIQQLIEELNIYHIELDMQNQELQLSNRKIIDERQKYKELYQNAPIAYFTINETGNIFDINKAAALMMGMPLQSFNRTSIFPYIDGSSKIEFTNFVKMVFKSSHIHSIDVKFIDRSGKLIYTQINAQSYFDESEQKKLSRLAVTDITTQIKNEQLIIEQNELLRLAFDNEKVAWWDWDYLSGEVKYSPNKATMMGYSVNEFPSNVYDITKLIHPDDYEETMDAMKNHLVGLTPYYEVSYRIKVKNGSYVHFYDFGKVIERKPNGTPIRINGIVFNLSEQKKYEYELMKAKIKAEINEQRLTLAALSGDLGIWDLDTTRNILIWDDRMFELYGIKRDSKYDTLESWINGVHSDDRQRVVNEYNLAMEGIKDFDLTFRVMHPDGTILHIKANALVIRDEFGQAIRMIGINRDVTNEIKRETEIIKSKELVEESERDYRLIAENTTDGILVIDSNSKVVYSSPVYLKLFGIEDNSSFPLDSKSIYELIHPDDRDELFANIYKAIESKQSELLYVYRFRGKDGNYIWREDNAKFQYDEFGNHLNSYVIARDITHRINTEQELRILKQAIESSKTSIIITDKNGNIEFANPFFTELTGYTQEEYIGKNPNIVSSSSHDNEFYQNLWGTIKSNKTWEGELYNKKKNGEFYWEYAIISPIKNGKNEINHFVAVKTDITVNKKFESELNLAKEKAEESDRLKSAFLQNISHEIRTPLNGILGFSKLLKLPNLSIEEINEYSELIIESGDRLLETVNNILDMALIQTKQLLIFERKFVIEALISDIYESFAEKAKQKGLHFRYSFDNFDDNYLILTDQIRLNQILNNLINNAIKFTIEGEIEFGYNIKGDFFEFYVKDTGIGINKELGERIFQRFSQVEMSISRSYEGNGLGLAICKGLVEFLGGKIWFESELGKGTTFYFTLPKLAD